MDIQELNEALFWLAEREGKISFSITLESSLKGLNPPDPTIEVEALSLPVAQAEETQGDGAFLCEGWCTISGGNVVGALLTAIKAAQKAATEEG
jgi:hypothetical protein